MKKIIQYHNSLNFIVNITGNDTIYDSIEIDYVNDKLRNLS